MKNTILTLISLILLIILIMLSSLTYQDIQKYNNSKSFYLSTSDFVENNINPIFTIDKITYFSGCNAQIGTNTNSSFVISDLYQYSDIAIFINNNHQNELTPENTLKSVEITDINYSLAPSIGQQNLYYKNIKDFAKPIYSKDNIISNSLNFQTTSENSIDYSTPILYNNCANPITLCYVNSNLTTDYTLSDDISNISYDGSLLKKCGITLNSLSCKLSFVINITNNLDEVFYCPLTLTIPLSTESSTIYDGNLTIKDSTSYAFIKS